MREKKRSLLPTLIVVLALVLTAVTGTLVAKYIYSTELTGTVTITAELGSITLQEHKAERNTDGSYKLDENQVVYANSYTLIPGLDIPKDPYITITDKTPLEAYLYLEVTDGLDSSSGISYTLESHWGDPINTKNNDDNTVTRVYVYGGADNPTKVTDQTNLSEIGILLDDTVYVSQGLNKQAVDLPLHFSARMVEVGSTTDPDSSAARERTALEAYNEN